MAKHGSFRDFDWFLLLFVLLICAIGTVQIYSATHATKFAGFHIKQMYWIGAGVGLMFLVSMIDYQSLLEYIHWVYAASVAALVAVKLFGTKVLGARRWISLHGFHFQPSEWVKLVLIIAIAKFCSDVYARGVRWMDILKLGALVGVPMLLVLIEPDLGTALTYMPAAVLCLFLAGLRFKQAAIIIIVGTLAVVPAWRYVLKPYQKERLTSFIDPGSDPRGSGYQILQSKIAVGAGGLTGRGTAQGSQTQGAFLPIPHTDFIFASFCEEHGFVGALFVLLLYFIVLMRLIQDAQTAPDRAGTFLVMGVVAILVFHILVNVGMVVGFMPVTGIPLPLMSYGGSSVLFTFLALGMVMNIRMRRFVN